MCNPNVIKDKDLFLTASIREVLHLHYPHFTGHFGIGGSEIADKYIAEYGPTLVKFFGQTFGPILRHHTQLIFGSTHWSDPHASLLVLDSETLSIVSRIKLIFIHISYRPV